MTLAGRVLFHRGVALVRITSFRGYKSSVHPDHLYPGSQWKTDRFQSVEPRIEGASHSGEFSGHIPIRELTITHSPHQESSLQPLTVVDIRFHLDSASWLSKDAKHRIKNSFLASELSRDGYLVVKSNRTRFRMLNQADALRKLRENLWAAIDGTEKKIPSILLDKEKAEHARKLHLRTARLSLREKKEDFL